MIFRTISQLIYAEFDKKCTIKKKRRLKMDDMACMKFRYLYLERNPPLFQAGAERSLYAFFVTRSVVQGRASMIFFKESVEVIGVGNACHFSNLID